MTYSGQFLACNSTQPENMADTSARTLRLLSLLQARRYWPGAELAGRLGVSARTLRRDVDRLRELGYPIQAQRGVDGGYQLAAGTALPPLVVDDEEAVALAVGLQVAAQGGGGGHRRGLDARAGQGDPGDARPAAPPGRGAERGHGPRELGEHHPAAAVDPVILTTVALACRDAERVRFSYTAAGGEQTDRHVEPLPPGRCSAAAGTWSATT